MQIYSFLIWKDYYRYKIFCSTVFQTNWPQYAVVLYGPTRGNPAKFCIHLVSHLALSLGYRFSSHENLQKASVIDFVQRLKDNHLNPYQQQKQVAFSDEEIIQLVDILSEHRYNIQIPLI